jgi:type II secretory pathway component PulJ
MMRFRRRKAGFTLAETAVASAIAAIILVAIVTGGVSMQRTFAGSDTSMKAQADQSRIMDYIARDLRQALYYQVCNSGQMLTLIVPDYVDYSASPPQPRLPVVHPGTLNQSTGLLSGTVDYNYANTCAIKVSYFPANAPTSPSTTYTYTANGQYLIRQVGNTQTVISKDCTSLQVGFTDQTTAVQVSVTFSPRFNFSDQTNDRTGSTTYTTTVFRSTPRTPTSTCLTCP